MRVTRKRRMLKARVVVMQAKRAIGRLKRMRIGRVRV